MLRLAATALHRFNPRGARAPCRLPARARHRSACTAATSPHQTAPPRHAAVLSAGHLDLSLSATTSGHPVSGAEPLRAPSPCCMGTARWCGKPSAARGEPRCLLAGLGSASSPPPAAVALPDGAASPHGTRAGQGKQQQQQRGGSGVAGCHRCGTEGKQGEARGASQAAAQQRAGRRRNSQLQKQTRSLPASTGEAGLPQERA